MILQSVVCFNFQSVSWVTSKSAVKWPFLRKMKAALAKKQVNLVKDAIKRNNRLAYTFSKFFVVALQDPEETIRTDRRQANSNTHYR